MSDKTDREYRQNMLTILNRFYRGRGASLLTKDESEALDYAISSIKTDLKYDLLYEGEDELCNGDCDNCDFVDGDYCRFNEKQQEIYMPPRLEPDNCGNYVVQDSTTNNTLAVDVPDNNVGKIEPTIKNDLVVDLISRADVLKLIYDYKDNHFENRKEYPINYGTLLDMIRWVRALPSVTPQELREITLEDVKGYCKPRCLSIISNELLYELTHPKIKALEQEPCEDTISRKSIKQKLQEHHDFFVNAYGGFSNLPQNDKSRVDEITNCIAMVVNEPSVTPQEPRKGEWLRMSDLSEKEDDRYKCSRCGNVVHHKNEMDLYTFNSWCGRCGSDNGR